MSEDLPFDKWLCFHVSARTASHSAGTRLLSKQNILGNVREEISYSLAWKGPSTEKKQKNELKPGCGLGFNLDTSVWDRSF